MEKNDERKLNTHTHRTMTNNNKNYKKQTNKQTKVSGKFTQNIRLLKQNEKTKWKQLMRINYKKRQRKNNIFKDVLAWMDGWMKN